jgi:hypothetical protein
MPAIAPVEIEDLPSSFAEFEESEAKAFDEGVGSIVSMIVEGASAATDEGEDAVVDVESLLLVITLLLEVVVEVLAAEVVDVELEAKVVLLVTVVEDSDVCDERVLDTVVGITVSAARTKLAD